MTLWRTDIVSRTFKFNCATTAMPKKGKGVRLDHSPTNLAEMLTMLRGMGFKPEDVAVYDMEFQYEHRNVYYP